MRITTDKYELIDVRRRKMYSTAVLRQAYSKELLYAWQGHHAHPRQEWFQRGIETPVEFYQRVRSEL